MLLSPPGGIISSQMRTRSFSKTIRSPMGPSTRASRLMAFPLVSIAADPVEAEAHEVVGLGGGGSGAVDQVIAQRREHRAVHDDGIVARVRRTVQGDDRAGEEIDQEVDRCLLFAWEGLREAVLARHEGPRPPR